MISPQTCFNFSELVLFFFMPFIIGGQIDDSTSSLQIGLYNRQFDDFVDLNAGEKTMMKLWNAHMCRFPVLGNNMLQIELDRFVDAHAAVIVGMNLYKNFLLHLTNLVEFGVLDQGGFFVELSLGL